jgi:16S rRNA (cytidine1402-2'-O)-methyltransferase
MDKNINKQSGTLYIVATPIGNLEDITLRAIRILKEVDLIAAEDTRRTKKLLNAYEIKTPLISLHEHNEKEKSTTIIYKIMSGVNVAYVSDAGTPCISDPGYYLVGIARQEKINVVPVPGPSAVVTALSAAGFPADNFLFCGFLPAKDKKLRQYLESLKNEVRTIVFYESPVRFRATIYAISDVLGDRDIVVAREMTKKFEEIKKGRIYDFIGMENSGKAKGEFTIVIKGEEKKINPVTDQEIEEKLLDLRKNKNLSIRDSVAEVATQTSISRKKIYNLAVKLNL